MTNSQFFPYAAYFLATDYEANEALLSDLREAAQNVPEDPEEITSVEALVSQPTEE